MTSRLAVQAERAANLLANLAGILLLGLALAFTVDVLLRWTISAPILGLYEVAELSFAVVMALALVWTNMRQSHVSMGILGQITGEAAPRLVAAALGLGVSCLFVWFLARYAGAKAGNGETSLVLGLPKGPFWSAAAVAMALATLAQLAIFLSELTSYLRRPAHRLRDLAPPGLMVVAALALLLVTAQYAPVLGAGPKILASFVILYLLALAHVPIGMALAIAGLGAVFLQMGMRPALLVGTNNLVGSLASVDLAAVPLFLIMGNLAVAAGFADDIFTAATSVFGKVRGGHALATVIGCAGFGAISGSSVATTATLGGVAYREMQARGYAPGFSTGSIAAGGTLGALIPPSVILIIYCVISEVSIAKSFIAAILPGVLALVLYIVSILIQVRLRPELAPAPDGTESFAPIRALRIAWRPIVLFLAVLGGLYGGVFTVQEAAAVGAGFAFVAWLVSGRASVAGLFVALRDAAGTSAGLYILIVGANIFGSHLNFAGMAQALAAVINPETMPVWAVLTLLAVMYLVLGSIFDSVAAVVITVPFVLPIILSMELDPIWWGIVTLTIVEIGMITPPIGMNVFVMKAVVGDAARISTIFRGVMPFLVADMLRMVLLVAFPVISLWLVGVLA
ncbi:TRAP transporter large permease subunit [Pannonibacter phragmitetus]|uniref:TRAP transporter large permease subunit n=1 Tax=Pannonibacter phragmitetus TaxID=121719 RepID=UPI00067BDA0A|nr:TRAP transporter large permease subunit [Pannonibacter phragmitetus]